MIPSCVYAMSLSPRAGTPCHRPPSHRRARMTTSGGSPASIDDRRARFPAGSIREDRLAKGPGRLVLLCQIWRPRSVGPHHPNPLLPSSLPPGGEKGKKPVKRGALEPSPPGRGGGEDGR